MGNLDHAAYALCFALGFAVMGESAAHAQQTAPPIDTEQEIKPAARPGLESPSPRQGHYLAIGVNVTAALANDRDRGTRGPAFGQGYTLRMGERIADWLDLGVSFAYGSVGGDDPWSFGRLTVHGQTYLRETWFVHGGFGFGAAGGDDPEDARFGRGRFGDVYTVGAGRNIYLTDETKSGGWILTPVVTGEYGRDDVFPNSALWFGLEISRWWGVSRNQLDLGFDEAYRRR